MRTSAICPKCGRKAVVKTEGIYSHLVVRVACRGCSIRVAYYAPRFIWGNDLEGAASKAIAEFEADRMPETGGSLMRE